MKVIVTISAAENELLTDLITMGWAKVPDTVTVVIAEDQTILPPSSGTMTSASSGTLSNAIIPADLFPAIFKWLIPEEGGYGNDPNDPGGPTKYGIDTKDDKAYWTALGVKDLRDLTLDQAEQIFREEYWTKCFCDTMPSPVAQVHFNYAVNTGFAQSIKFLQMALTQYVDGDFGPITRAALKAAKNPMTVAMTMINYADAFYHTLAKQPRFAADESDWINRNVHLRKFISSL